MIMCSMCNKNLAVVFITKIINGEQIQEGLCFHCAKKQGIKPINQLLEKTGMTEFEMDELNKSLNDFFEGLDERELNSAYSNPNYILDKKLPLFDDINNDFFEDETFNFKYDHHEKPTSHNFYNEKFHSEPYTYNMDTEKKNKFLDTYGTNLITRALEGKIDRVVGRSKEIDRVIQILNRRSKNNPILVGEPGVGKTAIAEGLALRIAKKQVPAKLFGSQVYILDLTSIVAGTQFRGQFEARMRGIIEEAKSIGNIILVIDELHNIMGAGEADGAMNAANILKPALSKGELHVIGATTLNEYRKHIEKDVALERRFQSVLVEEPSIQESIEIIKGIKDYYEKFHGIKIPDNVINTAVILSDRYVTDRFLPDKAIDVLDEAGSKINLENKKLIDLEIYRQELDDLQNVKNEIVLTGNMNDYEKIAEIKIKECRLMQKIFELENSKDIEITVQDVASVIGAWTKIPVQRLTEIEATKLLNLEERIHKRVIGQHEAVQSICKAIRRNRADFRKKRKPSSFIFVGPTGVGKTELVKALAQDLFGTEDAMIRLDMSEYMEKHTVSKLIGSPPGYVGFDEGSQFTEHVRRKPYSVVLFDEIEKAHPDIFNMLLQILEDGRLTDSHGRTVNFENTVIIMTSNAGTSFKANGLGFGNEGYGALENKVRNVLRDTFRPEFLNRIDDIIVFKELAKEELIQIIDLMLKEVISEGEAKGIIITFTQEVKEWILNKGYDSNYGARPLRRIIQKYLEDELAELFLKGICIEGSNVIIDCNNTEILFKFKNAYCPVSSHS